MINERRVNGIVAGLSWAAVVLMSAFYLVMGADWYSNGHMKICTFRDVLEPPEGHYHPPKTASDFDTLPYWCALQENRAAQAHGYAPPYLSLDQAKPSCSNVQSSIDNDLEPNIPGNDIDTLPSQRDCYAGTYEATRSTWNDDIISTLFRTVFQLIGRWASEILDPYFNYEFAPAWNAFFADDSAAASAHRAAVAYLAGAFFLAMLGLAVPTTVTWLRDLAKSK